MVLVSWLTDTVFSTSRSKSLNRFGQPIYIQGSVRLVQTRARLSFPRAASESEEVASSNLRSKDMVPSSDPPSSADVNVLYQFFEKR